MAPLTLELPSLAARGGRLVPGAARRFSVAQSVQIVKIGDFCNDCGNCDTFCPTSGAPYKVKPSFWLDDEGFREAKGDAYRMERDGGAVLITARLSGRSHRLECKDGQAEYRSDQVVAHFARDGAQGWKLVGAEAAGTLADGERVDLDTCATLIALLAAEPVLPVGLSQAPAPAAAASRPPPRSSP
jgi:hypothetical protein